jgi:flagellar basal-body rod protein FlgG
MLDSLYIGATGMQAQQLNVDTIANNLANVNTTGFKRARVNFEDLLYRTVATGNTATSAETETGGMGMGTAVASMGKVFTAGDIKKTGETLDLAINGAGFYEILMPDGTLAYTRNGAFQMDADGALITSEGYRLNVNAQIPSDATKVSIDANGRIVANIAGETKAVELGQIQVGVFTNPAGLKAVGDNLYVATEFSGAVSVANPGESGAGTLNQGFLEGSNVRLIDEMVGLIVAQRAYEINAKVVQASDEMLSISNGLYR